MTELEYVLQGFEEKLSFLKDMRILIHGSRKYAAAIIDEFSKSFCFVGVMSCDTVSNTSFHGLRVFEEDEFEKLEYEAVLLTERVKYAEAVYQAIHESCEQRGILLYNMYGVNELKAHRDFERSRPQSIISWKKTCCAYDLVAFEAMDTFLVCQDEGQRLRPRKGMKELARWMLDKGIDIRFSLRKSYPEAEQIAALKDAEICADLETKVMCRQGEDLSFRKLIEENPEKKILYIGSGLVNEFLLPACYGIDTCRFVLCYQSRPAYQAGWYVPVGNAEDRQFSYDKDWKERVRQNIRESSVVSFDVFDTLITRQTLYPWDIYELTETQLVKHSIPADGFAIARKATGESMPCATLDEIYGMLRKILNWEESIAQKAQQLEIEMEKRVIIPRTAVVELLCFAVTLRKKVVLTSDMYLSPETMRSILELYNIQGYDDLLISCDCRKEKRSGLFEELIRQYGEAENILHIGDDLQADGEAGTKAGIKTILLPSPYQMAESRGWQEVLMTPNTLIERCLLGMSIAEIFNNPFQNPNLCERSMEERLNHFSWSVTGPLMAGYFTWLLHNLRRTKVEGTLFLSRDGYLPMKIYQGLCDRYNLPKAYYYYTSRHAAFLCCADRGENIPRIISLGEYTGIYPYEKLRNVYSLHEHQIRQKRENETEEEYILSHMPMISEIACAQRKAVQTYYAALGLQENCCYAVVDCIATGTTQYFMEDWMPFKFYGYYLGNYSPYLRKSRNIEDYLEFQNDSLLKNYIEIESFFTSPEPSVWSISQTGEVQFTEEKRSAEELKELCIVHEKTLKFVQIFFDNFYMENEVVSPWVPEEMFAADGCHWVQRLAYDDWTDSLIPTKQWEPGCREKL